MLTFSVVLAFFLWMILFYWKLVNFWAGMTMATLLLAALSLSFGKKTLRLEWRVSFFPWGVGIALGLYLLFWAANRLIHTFLTPLGAQIGAIYGLKSQGSDLAIALALLLAIGPGEEIYWRGFLQETLMKRWGPPAGYLVSTAIYALVHLWSGNPALVLAALAAGAAWGLVYWRFRNLWPGIISHALWDLFSFVIFPYR